MTEDLTTQFTKSSTRGGTRRGTTYAELGLNFPCMAQNRQHYSAKPLAEYFQGKPRGAKAEAARAMGLPRQGIITNWIARDHIPGDKLPIVANYLGITVDEYLHRA